MKNCNRRSRAFTLIEVLLVIGLLVVLGTVAVVGYTGIKAGADKDFPENYFDAPLFLADLHAYVALVTGKSDYADDAVEHWIEASPESKCPPVYVGKKNSIWPGRAVMHLRSGHLLQYYFWKKGKK